MSRRSTPEAEQEGDDERRKMGTSDDRQLQNEIERLINSNTYRQTDNYRPTHRQTNRQTDRQTDR